MVEIQIKDVDAFDVMALPFDGPYDQTQDKLDLLMSWLLRVGHPRSGQPMGLYYEDPAKVEPEALHAEVAVPIEEKCEGEGDIVRKNLPAVKVAYRVHQGPYSAIQEVYEEVFTWMAEEGYRYDEGEPTREVFLQLYGDVRDPRDLVTEIQVPLVSV